MYQKQWCSAKAVLRGTHIELDAYIRKKDKKSINQASILGRQGKKKNVTSYLAKEKKGEIFQVEECFKKSYNYI